MVNNTPPLTFERDPNGLFKHIQYAFTPEGRVDWKKMLLPEHIYIKPDAKAEVEAKYGKSVSELDPIADSIEDRYLISTLAGARYLAWLRGVISVETIIHESNPGYASATCRLRCIPMYDSIYTEYCDSANAHIDNTDKFMKLFFVEAAVNRAFVRAVRGLLNISIVSKEEISYAKPTEDKAAASDTRPSKAPSNIATSVKKALKRLGYAKFDHAKEKLIELGVDASIKDLAFDELTGAHLFVILDKLESIKDETRGNRSTVD